MIKVLIMAALLTSCTYVDVYNSGDIAPVIELHCEKESDHANRNGV